MQAIRVDIDVIGLCRMQLHHAFVLVPEGVLDPRHFLPIRDAAAGRNRNMFPAILPSLAMIVSFSPHGPCATNAPTQPKAASLA
jgi:hypothetical protein